MPSKRKRVSQVRPRSHHPSQSSIDVPATIKNQVKALQDNRCWFCNQKAHKKFRPLQVCHLYPQALSKRFKFERHHKSSRTQLDNIHSVRNLVPLCSICHLAFDQEEWTFLPKDMAAWVQDAKAKPEGDSILEYNAQEDMEFRRWRLQIDPDSEAGQDSHYVSAFTDRPIQTWQGEAGVLILRNVAILETPRTPEMDVELKEALDIYNELKEIWMLFDKPCSVDQCRICSHKGGDNKADEDEEDEGGEGDEGDEEDEEGEGDEGDEEDEEGEGDEEDKEDQEDQEDGKDEEDERDEGGQPSSKAKKTTYQNQLNGTRPTNRSRYNTTHNTTQKENKPKQRKKSALYDKSVPYSHREGPVTEIISWFKSVISRDIEFCVHCYGAIMA
ncbi:MAG: hypothetical protein M1840_008517 [Geoglossum simile]|nr:MAG: hypothetical protein M1840_008517 [Geoglossum simile]